MHTLQEFMYHTKAWEYIIVIVFVSGFIGYWRLLTIKSYSDEDDVR